MVELEPFRRKMKRNIFGWVIRIDQEDETKTEIDTKPYCEFIVYYLLSGLTKDSIAMLEVSVFLPEARTNRQGQRLIQRKQGFP